MTAIQVPPLAGSHHSGDLGSPNFPVQFALANAEREHMIQSVFRIGVWGLFRKLNGFADLPLEFRQQLLLPGICPKTALREVALHRWNRIAGLPVLQLPGRAVFRGINLRMAIPTVGLALDQRRPISLASAAYGFLRRLVYRNHVVPIHGCATHPVGLRFDAEIRHRTLEPRRNRLCPKVILQDENNRQLLHARKVQRLVPKPQAGGTFAGKGHDYTRLLLHLVGQGNPGADRELCGNRRRRRDDVERSVSAMGLRTTPLVRACLSQEDVSKHQFERRSLHEVSDKITVRRCNRIFRKQVHGGANLGCLLPHGGEVVAGESPLPVQEAYSFLHGAAFQHVAVQPPQCRFFQRRMAVECCLAVQFVRRSCVRWAGHGLSFSSLAGYAARCPFRRVFLLVARYVLRATALLRSVSWELYTSVTRPRRAALRIGSRTSGFASSSAE